MSVHPVVVSIQRPKSGGERIEQYLRIECKGTDASIRKAVDRLLKDPEAHEVVAPPYTFMGSMTAGKVRREAAEAARQREADEVAA